MKFIADFHIHSHYSIATSKNLRPEWLDYWGKMKGISVIGTGDFTHPGWIKELKEKLQPAEPGLFKLKNDYEIDTALPHDNKIRFMLTAEISSIYKKENKVRKVHNVLFAPDFSTVEKIQHELSKIGNITSDGRPILGLDSRNLLEIALNCSENIFFIPAHIWTPWFSALGSKSGFDSIEECYDDLADYIYAVETGLSSDPPMNWMCSFLDKYTIISNSDAHSPEKLGREANLFNTELSYNSIVNALKTNNQQHFLGTVEFFPQEGKYHFDGHRKCGISWDPVETLKHDGKCTVCGKKVTIGVMNRVAQLSDRKEISQRKKRNSFYSLIPFKEILSEVLNVGPNSKQVTRVYNSIIQKAGSEFNVLLNMSISDLNNIMNDLLTEAIKRMRAGEVYIKEGFDGEFGQIKVFTKSESQSVSRQETLFNDTFHDIQSKDNNKEIKNFNLQEYNRLTKNNLAVQTLHEPKNQNIYQSAETTIFKELNVQQQKAVEYWKGPALIIAGPGTGKTRVLTDRIAYLIQNRNINPENILAVTFTNKAADEMKERLAHILDDNVLQSKLHVSTFHSLGYLILTENIRLTGRKHNFLIIDEDDRKQILNQIVAKDKVDVIRVLNSITQLKQNLKSIEELDDGNLKNIFKKYEEILRTENLFDLDDLIYLPVKLFQQYEKLRANYQKRFLWIMIDEYQDINFAQYQLIRCIAPATSSNIYVIGDANQAIYGFRGADVKFINKFIDDYPGAIIYKLRQSYRCTDLILKASKKVIRDTDSMLEGLQKGIKINISEQDTDKSEAEFVARTIEKMIGGLRFFSIDSAITEGDQDTEIRSLSDFAVLCRISKQMEAVEKAFFDHSIPFQTVTDLPFFKKEPIRSIIKLLKLSINTDNNFLKNELIKKSIIDTMAEISELTNLVKHNTVKNSIAVIIEKYFSDKIEKNKTAFEYLFALANDYGSNFSEFLKFTSLGTGMDMINQKLENVMLMTLHAAKGLEFECVFIIGCEDGILPYSIFEQQKSDIDEERRLLYVGMTRAKKYLFLSHARKRFLFGKEYRLARSPFLNNIEKGLIDLSKSEYKRKAKKDENQLSLF